MSSEGNSNNATQSTTQTTTTNVDDLVSQLRQKINGSDWLVHNSSVKWEQENPELARQWREATKTNKTNDTSDK